MFRIGEFSKLAKLSIKTLRYYDRIGLLKPAFVDQLTMYRYYTEDQLLSARLITGYKEVGLTNDDIAALLLGGKEEAALLQEQLEELRRVKAELESRIEGIEKMLGGSQKDAYEATLVNVAPCTVYCARGYVAGVSQIHDFIKSCAEEFTQTNPDVGYGEPDYCCVIYPEDGFRESNVFIEYVQSVDRMGKDTPVLKFKTLAPIMAVSVIHKGDYINLRDAYLFAVQWAKNNGYKICGEARERHIAGAWNRSDKSEWITEVQLPVCKE